MGLRIRRRLVAKICRDAEKHYPSECCGILIGPVGRPGVVTRVEAVPNIQEKMHREDPRGYPRTSRKAYLMDPGRQLQIIQEVEASGEEIRGFYHSHPDERAFFSQMDRRLAAPWGEPLYPDASFVVVSVRKGKAGSSKQYRWDNTWKSFREEKLLLGLKGTRSTSGRPPVEASGQGRRPAAAR